MPRFAANLTMMYNEVPFLERFEAAARDGFKAVEFLFPYAHTPEEIGRRLSRHGLELVLFNLPPGNWDAGERGIASLPGREAEFARGVAEALRYARILHCPRLHVMAGIPPQGADRAASRAAYIRALQTACDAVAKDGITVLIEPINTRDIPGYFLNRQDEAHDIRSKVGRDNLKVQMDLYHCQIVEGDVAMKIRRTIGDVGHIQVAGVPERHEPSVGEVNYPYLFELLDSVGYAGWVGCEYRPRAGTSAGLDWLAAYKKGLS